jgi:hypothetical protein
MSADTKDLNVGVAATPEDGPANTKLAFCVLNVPVNVPLVVTGEPDTVNIDGKDNATEVTVPSPAADAHAKPVPLYCK